MMVRTDCETLGLRRSRGSFVVVAVMFSAMGACSSSTSTDAGVTHEDAHGVHDAIAKPDAVTGDAGPFADATGDAGTSSVTRSTSGRFDSVGGRLSLGRLVVVVPPLAVVDEIVVTVSELAQPPNAAAVSVSPLYRFEPSGTRFLRPVEVSIPATGTSTKVRVLVAADVDGPWTDVGGTYRDGYVTARLEHFTVAGAFVNTSTAVYACDPGYRLCRGVCVSNQDPDHCGRCFNACLDIPSGSTGNIGPACVGGDCMCNDKERYCDGDCVDVMKDPSHCGRCDNACPAGQLCSFGRCATSHVCPTTSNEFFMRPKLCDGECVDLLWSNANCGACGSECRAQSICTWGVCTCELADTGDPQWIPRGHICGAGSGACVNVMSDEAHCGGCDNACPQGYECRSGRCVDPCRDGATTCPDVGCRDLKTDRDHCGSCGEACADHQACDNGACGACDFGFMLQGGRCVPSNTSPCGNEWVDLQNDRNHCGSCVNACPADEFCRNGQCASCGVGVRFCSSVTEGDACVGSFDGNPEHCGACFNRCNIDAGEYCLDGQCRAPTTLCENTLRWCDGQCVDTAEHPNHCGQCDHVCTGGDCNASRCVCSDQARPSLCTNPDRCVDLQTSRADCGSCGNTCAQGQECAAGQCRAVCTQTQTRCNDGLCHNLTNDNAHCGACQNACPQGQTCVNRQCTPTSACAVDWRMCEGQGEFNVNTTRAHCGQCFHACDQNQYCNAGNCVSLGDFCGPETPMRCTNQCVDLNTNAAHCGCCNNACPQNEVCHRGKCVSPQ